MNKIPPSARIIAVLGALVLVPGCTTTQQQTSGARPVMIYDTATGQLVSRDAYNMKPGKPASGQ